MPAALMQAAVSPECLEAGSGLPQYPVGFPGYDLPPEAGVCPLTPLTLAESAVSGMVWVLVQGRPLRIRAAVAKVASTVHWNKEEPGT